MLNVLYHFDGALDSDEEEPNGVDRKKMTQKKGVTFGTAPSASPPPAGGAASSSPAGHATSGSPAAAVTSPTLCGTTSSLAGGGGGGGGGGGVALHSSMAHHHYGSPRPSLSPTAARPDEGSVPRGHRRPLRGTVGPTGSGGGGVAGGAGTAASVSAGEEEEEGRLWHSSNGERGGGASLTLRERVHLFMTEPGSSRGAFYFSIFFMVLILLSTLAFVMETVPNLSSDEEYGNPDNKPFWFWSETVFTACFTAEYFVAFAASPRRRSFPCQIFSIVDLLAIVPYYVELIFMLVDGSSNVNLRFIRVVRLARVFRILKMGKKFDGADILYQVIKTAFPALVPPFFFLFLGIVFFSSCIYICEQGEYDKTDHLFYVDDVHGNRVVSTFISIPESLWWCLVTMTTVGYGDTSPQTIMGRLVASLAMIFGVIFSAMPIAIIGATFTVKWHEMKLRLNAAKDFQSDDHASRTTNWCGDQLKFFSIGFAERSAQSIDEFLRGGRVGEDVPPDIAEALRVLEYHEHPEKYVSRRLSHELLTNRDRIEKGVLPQPQWNLAYKLYHIMRAESSKCENNIETYTLDFLAELYHTLGFGVWDPQTNVHIGFRTKAGLSVTFGEGAGEKCIKSDSDLGVFTLLTEKSGAAYFVANQANLTAAGDNPGRVAGELLAVAQHYHRASEAAGGTGDPLRRAKTVFLVTASGYHLRFYAAEFEPAYLDAIARGKKPADGDTVVVRSYPPKLSKGYNRATMMGTFDFLTPSHREEAIELFVRIRRSIIACSQAHQRMQHQRLQEEPGAAGRQSFFAASRSMSMLKSALQRVS